MLYKRAPSRTKKLLSESFTAYKSRTYELISANQIPAKTNSRRPISHEDYKDEDTVQKLNKSMELTKIYSKPKIKPWTKIPAINLSSSGLLHPIFPLSRGHLSMEQNQKNAKELLSRSISQGKGTLDQIKIPAICCIKRVEEELIENVESSIFKAEEAILKYEEEVVMAKEFSLKFKALLAEREGIGKQFSVFNNLLSELIRYMSEDRPSTLVHTASKSCEKAQLLYYHESDYSRLQARLSQLADPQHLTTLQVRCKQLGKRVDKLQTKIAALKSNQNIEKYVRRVNDLCLEGTETT